MAGFLKNILPVVLASVILVYLSSVYGEEVKASTKSNTDKRDQGNYTLTLSGAINAQRSGTIAYIGKGTSGGYNLLKLEFAETLDEREQEYRLTLLLATADDLDSLQFPMPGTYPITRRFKARPGYEGGFDPKFTEVLELNGRYYQNVAVEYQQDGYGPDPIRSSLTITEQDGERLKGHFELHLREGTSINKGQIGRGTLAVKGEFDAVIITEDLGL
ncbi:hypothetical protein CWI80_10130 [Pseudidiomarina sediminum]|uniref:Uncharacterized protein n=1 Tax=Pseudidiomarina sediminum TaxID=431675 RepID=A0A432Z2S6_9GAMM|nr:hypothetical protein [Pseudidiomarina sediminum]RUO72149.1 hypothetical protein CWI80_10130 [Pseudidiomarina sediminum]